MYASSATEHTGLHGHTFKGSEPALVIDVGHKWVGVLFLKETSNYLKTVCLLKVLLVMRGEISDDFPIFFYGVFDQPPQEFGVWEGESYLEDQRQADITQNHQMIRSPWVCG